MGKSSNVYIIIASNYNPRNSAMVCEYVYLSHDFEDSMFYWSEHIEDVYTFPDERSAKTFLEYQDDLGDFGKKDIHIEKVKIIF